MQQIYLWVKIYCRWLGNKIDPMQERPSWKASSSSASQEILRTWQKPKVLPHTQKFETGPYTESINPDQTTKYS
jgi:hypothetical protein